MRRQARERVNADPFDVGAALDWVAGDPRRQLIAAQAVDEYYSPLAAGVSALKLPPGLQDARLDHLCRGRLDSPADHGRMVILRRPLTGRWSDPDADVPEGEGVASYFDTLLLTPATLVGTDADDAGSPASLSLSFVVCPARIIRLLPPNRPWKLGIAPVVQEAQDLDVRCSTAGAGSYYDSVAVDLPVRVAAIVEELCREGCGIIAFPEMALSPVTLDALKRAVAAHGPGSNLSLVLAGSTRTEMPGAGRPYNRSCTLNHRGEVLFTQDKLARWNLATATCQRYGLEPAPSGMMMEHIETGSELVVAEIPGLGRLATLICEDLGRSEPGRWVRRHLLLDMQYTPVMDSDLHFARWTASTGGKAAFDGSCRVLVVNSLPLSLRQNDVNQKLGTGSVVARHGIGLLFDRIEGTVRGAEVRTASPGGVPCHEVVEWNPVTWTTLHYHLTSLDMKRGN